ncbi:hypothetical protein [Clostridium cellulovorans]|uniref:Uncharacterized protein n=1 Tax=Clostridium cellulovorans (strain ATCC 35296 / DSM 3052 / OCM 3 / 743B) TaxID=573061 RepID=D9SPS3_CLOC7|nr:hypothetical protein [Clostridium cellulovorans]ADL52059.1 hypothetical protein Clocel_2341 [Clostridium cellulovorans 743B]
MEKNKTLIRKMKDKLWMLVVTAYTVMMLSTPAYASISGSKIMTGTQRLISDATTALMVLSPIASVLLFYEYHRFYLWF